MPHVETYVSLRLNAEPRSHVYRTDPPDGWVYKEQPKYNCDNEVWAYDAIANAPGSKSRGPYVPKCERVSVEIIRTTDLGPHQQVTDPEGYLGHFDNVVESLFYGGVHHGDLTSYSVLPRGNRPWIIDFAECRYSRDPRPDKREDAPDKEMLAFTMRKQAVRNLRSPEIWHQIKQVVNFAGASVLDVGCGKGDMLLFAANAGARSVIGIDPDIDEAGKRVKNLPINLWATPLESYVNQHRERSDVVLCLSTLPYISNSVGALTVLKQMGRQVVLEIQAKGDGPGKWTEFDMIAHLNAVWDSVERIGQTIAKKDKNYKRAIWLCQ